jgi:hypothetical protein
MSNTIKLAGAFGAGVLASIGAYQVINVVIGHRWGDLPELAGGVTLLAVTWLCVKGLEEIDRPRREEELERQREALKKMASKNQ